MRAESSPTQWERERKLKKEGKKERGGEMGVKYSKDALNYKVKRSVEKRERKVLDEQCTTFIYNFALSTNMHFHKNNKTIHYSKESLWYIPT